MTEHVDIPDGSRHEPKGASTATAGEVYTADGLGSGDWSPARLAGQSSAAAGTIPYSTGGGNISWGTLDEKSSTVARSTVSQNPTGTNNPMQVTFDSAVSTSDVSITASGLATVQTSGLYLFGVTANFGRTNNTGTAILLTRVLVNDTQIFGTLPITLEGTSSKLPYSILLPIDFTAGDEVKIQIARDSAGNNDGGLFPFTPALGWVGASSIGVNFTRIGVV